MSKVLAKSDQDIPDWIRIQTKTFTRWCNKITHAQGHIFTCIEDDFADGVSFNILVSCLVNENLIIHPHPKTNFAKLENLNKAFYVLTEIEKITLINISAEDLLNKNKKLVLGLVWTLIQRYQISHQVDLKSKTKSVLLSQVNSAIKDSNISVGNFSDHWKDTSAFSALVNSISPNTFDVVRLSEDEECIKKLNSIFDYADKNLEITNLLDAEDVVKCPDELSMMSYISMYLNCLERKNATCFDHSKVIAEGTGIEQASVGKNANFRVILDTKSEDIISNKNINVTAELVKITEPSDEQKCVPVTIKNSQDGVYDASYVAEEPGLYCLQVLVNGQPINTSPFQVKVEDLTNNPENFHATGAGIDYAISEKDMNFVIERVDGAPIQPTVKFEAYLEVDEKKIPIKLNSLGDKGYHGQYFLKDVDDGAVSVNVMMNKDDALFHVKGSPYAVTLYSIDKGNIDVVVDECSPVVAGNPICVHIRAKDHFGNSRPIYGLPLEVELGSNPPVKADIVDKGDGNYECSMVQTKAGKYPLTVSMQGKSVSNAEPIEVVPDVPCSDKTVIYLMSDPFDEEHKFRVEEPIKGQVMINDQYGNRISDNQTPISLELISPTGKKIDIDKEVNSEGILNFNFIPDEQGIHNLSAKIGEEDTAKPSFKLNVSDSDRESNVWVCENTKSKFKAGEEAEYVLHTDAWVGKKLKDGLISLSAKLPHVDVICNVVESEEDCDSWVIICKFLPCVAGCFELGIELISKNHSLSSFSFPTQVVPAEADPHKSSITKVNSTKIYAGNPWQCKFSLMDSYGNPITEGASLVEIKLTQLFDRESSPLLPDDLKLKSSVTPAPTLSIIEGKDGIYIVDYEPIKTAGKYRLYVILNGISIENSPLTFLVKPLATISPSMTYLSGVADGRVGEEQTVTLVCRDEFGNLTGSRKAHASVKLNGPEKVQVHVTYQQDGIYVASCCPTVAGEYVYRVHLDKKEIDLSASGMPYKLWLYPTDVDGTFCTATGDGLFRAKSLVDANFRIQLRDRFGNAHKTNPGVSVNSYLLHVSSDAFSAAPDFIYDPITVSLSDLGDGTIEAKYQVSYSGEYAIHVLVQEKSILKSPFSVKATAGPYCIDHTLVQISDKNVAGCAGPIIKLRDQVDNICTKNKPALKAVLKQRNHMQIPLAKDGSTSYVLTYPHSLSGDYDLSVHIDNQEIPNGPWHITIEKNPLNEQSQQIIKNILPESANILINCLEQVEEDKRYAIIKELQNLSRSQNRQSVHTNHSHREKKKKYFQEQ